jgi:hypothetical protein
VNRTVRIRTGCIAHRVSHCRTDCSRGHFARWFARSVDRVDAGCLDAVEKVRIGELDQSRVRDPRTIEASGLMICPPSWGAPATSSTLMARLSVDDDLQAHHHVGLGRLVVDLTPPRSRGERRTHVARESLGCHCMTAATRLMTLIPHGLAATQSSTGWRRAAACGSNPTLPQINRAAPPTLRGRAWLPGPSSVRRNSPERRLCVGSPCFSRHRMGAAPRTFVRAEPSAESERCAEGGRTALYLRQRGGISLTLGRSRGEARPWGT